MRNIIILTFLCGCSISFDSIAYNKMVNATSSINPNICDSKDYQKTIKEFQNQLDWLIIYESGLPDNSLTADMLKNISKEVDNLETLSSTSIEYCKLKMESMRHGMSLIIDTEGKKK